MLSVEQLIFRMTNIFQLFQLRWSLIAGRLPGRTDNEIKNYWNTFLKKKLNLDGLSGQACASLPDNPIQHKVTRNKALHLNMEPRIKERVEMLVSSGAGSDALQPLCFGNNSVFHEKLEEWMIRGTACFPLDDFLM